MSLEAAGVIAGLRTPHLVRLHRLAIVTLAGVSLAFVSTDAWGLIGANFYDETLHAARWDMPAELFARLLMLGLAVLCACVTRGSRDTRLLMWALVLCSFDVYWQTAYGHGGMQYVAMALKYTAVPLGLMCLLRFCANFGGGDYYSLRATVYNAAPYAALALVAVGLTRGFMLIQNCDTVDGTWYCLRNASAVTMTYQAYIAGDAALRAAAIFAAVVGVVSAKQQRLQLALVALTSVLMALGTMMDFAARFTPVQANVQAFLVYFDGIATLCFPIGLTVALFARQLFDADVDYVLRRVIALTVTTTIVLAAFAGIHALLHLYATTWLTGQVGLHKPGTRAWLKTHDWVPEVATGTVLIFGFHWIEEWVLRFLDEYVLPDRKQRLQRLREIGESLFRFRTLEQLLESGVDCKVKGAAGCVFVDVFWNDDRGVYRPLARMFTDAVLPGDIDDSDPIVTKYLNEGKRAPLRERVDWTNAEVAFPMFVGKRLYGFLACGRKYHPTLDGVYDAFDTQELHELEVLSRQLGMVLHGLGAAV